MPSFYFPSCTISRSLFYFSDLIFLRTPSQYFPVPQVVPHIISQSSPSSRITTYHSPCTKPRMCSCNVYVYDCGHRRADPKGLYTFCHNHQKAPLEVCDRHRIESKETKVEGLCPEECATPPPPPSPKPRRMKPDCSGDGIPQ